MPAAPIYAKAIQNFTATVANDFLTIEYTIIDNYDTVLTTGDSSTTYYYNFPEKAISLKLLENNGGAPAELFELCYQNVQLSFAKNEFYNVNSVAMLDPAAYYTAVLTALGL